MKRKILFVLLSITYTFVYSKTLTVGKGFLYSTVKSAISEANDGDTIFVHKGLYKEGNILIDKSLILIGVDTPVIDGDRKYEVVSIKADNVLITGFKIQHSGYATLDDPGGIKIYESNNVQIVKNLISDNFFGIYIQYSKNCIVRDNVILAYGKQEQEIGNGIHCWKSDSLLIIGNFIKGNRDGIYFEFVTNSVIWRNVAVSNIRYGLHFMFSHNDSYYTNLFRDNGAGVAVMYSRNVSMMNNTFDQNWGDASYGILLKEISDGEIYNNKFNQNTIAILMDGANRLTLEKNEFSSNGWALKIQANCMDNVILYNNFRGNTFDVSTNGQMVLNIFKKNYWDRYEGYDLDKDKIGDVPYRPLSIFSMLVETTPPAMLLFRSFMITLLDKSEKVLPSLTPEDFIDNEPLMKPVKL